jgi:hypothetical protein
MKSIKEKQLLVKWSKAMNEPIDAGILEEVERFNSLQNDVLESVRRNTISDLIEAQQVAEELVTKINLDYPKPPTLDELMSIVQEETNELVQTQPKQISVTEETPTPTPKQAQTLAQKAVQHITKEVRLEEKADSFQQPDPALVEKNLEAVQKKLKFLEQAIGKIAATGPGGGAGDVITLDHPVKLVTSNYTITRKDFYVGVNATTTINVTLPDLIGFPGRMIIIKDESGNCSSNPIVVLGNVDNDPGGFILAQDNGGIQMIYREGWRIV